jgi:hypothetical protein
MATGSQTIFLMAGGSGSIDEKGVISHTCPYYCPKDRDPSDQSAFPDTPEQPVLRGELKEQSRNWKDNGDGSYTVYITYEGGEEGGGQGTQGRWFDGDEATYELAASLKDIPIEQHPGIAGLMEQYHGTRVGNGVVEFAQGTPSAPNPMFGVKTFKCVSGTLRRTRIVTTVDPKILEGVGSVTTQIGQFPQLKYEAPDGKGGKKSVPREWLKLTPTITKRGSKFTLTEEYMLSPKGGFPQYVYDLLVSA